MSNAIWLLKTEPEEFSIDDLARRGEHGERWNGIRNYQARNFLRQMQVGDRILIYHSACAVPAIVGEAFVTRAAYPDQDALDARSTYFDAKSTADNIRWSVVEIRFHCRYSNPVSLQQIKRDGRLEDMALLKQARLSVSPVTEKQYQVLSTLTG